ncbi:unnamed protein product [Acanthosepion pharaonis]|uniref:Uncharacterized protein n=1 Tax=Acanthosepion pharaonis TaxID=158019 RepID=A0A812AZM7_ACAPH|nr:unnamed protein product [Sepia pharaonis]
MRDRQTPTRKYSPFYRCLFSVHFPFLFSTLKTHSFHILSKFTLTTPYSFLLIFSSSASDFYRKSYNTHTFAPPNANTPQSEHYYSSPPPLSAPPTDEDIFSLLPVYFFPTTTHTQTLLHLHALTTHYHSLSRKLMSLTLMLTNAPHLPHVYLHYNREPLPSSSSSALLLLLLLLLLLRLLLRLLLLLREPSALTLRSRL